MRCVINDGEMPAWAFRIGAACEIAQRSSGTLDLSWERGCLFASVRDEVPSVWHSTVTMNHIAGTGSRESAFRFLARQEPDFARSISDGLETSADVEHKKWFVFAMGTCGRYSIAHLDVLLTAYDQYPGLRKGVKEQLRLILLDAPLEARCSPLATMLAGGSVARRNLAVATLADLQGAVYASPALKAAILAQTDDEEARVALAIGLYCSDEHRARERVVRALCGLSRLDQGVLIDAFVRRHENGNENNLALLGEILSAPSLDDQVRLAVAGQISRTSLVAGVKSQIAWTNLSSSQSQLLEKALTLPTDGGRP